MPQSAELILSSRRVALPTGEASATIVVRAGRIAEILPYDSARGEDLGTLCLLPGLVDTHVHLNQPGHADWEGAETGTAAAAAGGVTTLVDMPLNSLPVTTNTAALVAKRTSVAECLSVDVGFYGGVIPGNESELEGLLDAGALGLKAFLCHSGLDEFPAAAPRELRPAMQLLSQRGLPLLAHAELSHDVPPTEGDPRDDSRNYATYLASRPPSFERRAIELLIALCFETGCRTHIVHLADAQSLPILREARERGLPLTVETCPHYLTFAAEEIPTGATLFKCTPPIRDAENREALWRGLRDKVIDMVVSDHSPCPPALKCLDTGRFDRAWGGVNSLELGLPVMHTEALRRGFTLADVVRWMSAAPAGLVDVPAGIAVGAPANLVVFDPETEWNVEPDRLRQRHKLTPYAGRRVCGVVRRTLVHGQPAHPGGGQLL